VQGIRDRVSAGGCAVERVLQQRVVEGARRRVRDRVLAKSTIPHAAPSRIAITTTSPVTEEIATVPVHLR